jgi:hypothetical protein
MHLIALCVSFGAEYVLSNATEAPLGGSNNRKLKVDSCSTQFQGKWEEREMIVQLVAFLCVINRVVCNPLLHYNMTVA